MSRGIDQTTRRARVSLKPDAGQVIAYWDGGYLATPLSMNGAVVIGRDSTADVRVPHPSVSRSHVRLSFGPKPAIEDLGSVNGTRLAGRSLTAHTRTPIPCGAVIEIGDALVLLKCVQAESKPVEVAAESMSGVRELIDRVAKGNIPVTLVGETGVGKEVMADRLHAASPRAGAPFLRINCAALPEQLLESELFGYERGAFTGANNPKPGLLEAAHGGTVFLDEVGELPKPTQAKLLRALECKEIFRIGSLRPRTFDVRFVAATNRNLEAMVGAGDFRADLFHRLCGVVVRVPSLRERGDEIEELSRTFVDEVAEQLRRPAPELCSAFLLALQSYAWPGNVRELRHTIECAVLLCPGSRLETAHLPRTVLATPSRTTRAGAPNLKTELDDLEKKRILDALERCAGNQTRTASVLGIPRRTLIDRIETYGLPRPRKGRE